MTPTWDVTCANFQARDWLGLDDHVRADLVIADPPYNQGVKYDGHDDRMEYGDFCNYLVELADACDYCLRPGGIACVLMGSKYQADLHAAFASAEHNDFPLRMVFDHVQSIVWAYTFGQSGSPKQRQRLTDAFVMVHVFGKRDGPYRFNAKEVMVPSARQTKYKDRRANPDGKVMDNVWTISRVCGTFKEKVDYPNQLPLELTDRLVRTYSAPGELVVDPCCGSGTAGVSAVRLGRNFLGLDISTQACVLARRRITEVAPAVQNRYNPPAAEEVF